MNTKAFAKVGGGVLVEEATAIFGCVNPKQKQRISVCLVEPPFGQHVYSHVSCCVFGLLNLMHSVTGVAQESHLIRNHGERWASQAIFVLVAFRFQRAGGRIPRVLQEGHALHFLGVGCS